MPSLPQNSPPDTGGGRSRALRLDSLRARMRARSVDALVVSHLPNIQYLTGFPGTTAIAVVTAAACDLIVDSRYAVVARALPDAIAAEPAVTVRVLTVSYDAELLACLDERDAGRSGRGGSRIAVEAARMTVATFSRLSAALARRGPLGLDQKSATPPVLVPTEQLVEEARLVKDADEIAVFRTAGRMLAEVARDLPALARPGRSEREVAAEIDFRLRAAGFERPAFETIVASGPNAALPHARPGDRRLGNNDAVVLDFGGVYDGYSVDLTRTVELGDAGVEFRRMFAAVAEAQRAAISAVRPGVAPSEVDAVARRTLGRYGLEGAFGHGTGHGLGLEVHEEPRVGRPLPGVVERPLAAGMVVTIEPGVYVEGRGGVRIEDDVLVTEAGCEILTVP